MKRSYSYRALIHLHKLLHTPRKLVVIFGIIFVFAFILTQKTQRVVAQEIGNVLDVVKEKLGFEVSSRSPHFIYSKITPNYVAYAGDEASLGGHKVRLERDGALVDLQFISADVTGESTASAIVISPSEIALLDNAEQAILEGTQSAAIDASRTILQRYTQQEIASDAGLLLVQLKAFKIQRLSLDVDLKLAEISRDVSTVMSRAALVEDDRERIVTFSDIPLGLTMNYRLNEGGITQEIIINQKDRMHSQFTFDIDLHGLTYKNVGNGVWYFSDSAGSILRLPKGYARDTDGATNNDVQTKIENTNGKDVLTIFIPEAWMTDTKRAYPVTIFSGIEVIPELRQGGSGPLQLPEFLPTIPSSPSATPTLTSELSI